MFDNLTPESEGQNPSEETKKVDTPLGQGNNIPANLASTFGSSIGSTTPPKPAGLGEEFNQRMQQLQEKGKKRGIKFSRIGIITGSIIALVVMGIVYYLLNEVIGYTEKAQESSVNIPAIGRDNKNQTEKKSEKINLSFSDEALACTIDEDCSVVLGQCCPCEKGGNLIAINKNFQSAWDEEFANKCTKALCDEVTTCPTGRAYCDGMTCRFVAIDSPVIEAENASTTEPCVGNNCPLNPEENVWVENSALTDTDQDGILDAEEMDFGTDIGKPDTDGDGILDGEELKLKTSPIKPDTDGDGILDKDEITLGTDPTNLDTDGDGFSDGSEIINGYNPLGSGLLNREQAQQ